MKSIEITVTFTDAQAWELAQLLKRMTFSDYRDHAASDGEAYLMRDAAELLRRVLADQGYAPR